MASGTTVPPKSKRNDLLIRVATSLHVVHFVMSARLENITEEEIRDGFPLEIRKETLEKARACVDHLEEQKEAFVEVSIVLTRISIHYNSFLDFVLAGYKPVLRFSKFIKIQFIRE